MITNSTYDGLLYNTQFIKESLDCKHIHFDSAWVPYTNFNRIYEGKCGMSGEAMPGKVFYETSPRTNCWRRSRKLDDSCQR